VKAVVSWPHGDPNVVAKAVLAQAAYRHLAPSNDQKPSPSIWQLALDWVVDHVLRPLFRPLFDAVGHSKGVGTVVGTALIVIALGALGFLLFRLTLAFARPAFARGPGDDGRPLGAEHTREDWLALAREAAARGDFGRAIAALFAAALAALDDRAVVAFDPARTPGEYRRLVRRSLVVASAPFDALADCFVRAAYAPAAPARTDFEAAERAFADFEPLVSG